jgi:hypothetical protein
MIATFSTLFTDDKLFGYKQKFLKKKHTLFQSGRSCIFEFYLFFFFFLSLCPIRRLLKDVVFSFGHLSHKSACHGGALIVMYGKDDECFLCMTVLKNHIDIAHWKAMDTCY